MISRSILLFAFSLALSLVATFAASGCAVDPTGGDVAEPIAPESLIEREPASHESALVAGARTAPMGPNVVDPNRLMGRAGCDVCEHVRVAGGSK